MTERFRLHIITDQDVFRHQLHALWSTIGRHLYVSYYIQAQPNTCVWKTWVSGRRSICEGPSLCQSHLTQVQEVSCSEAEALLLDQPAPHSARALRRFLPLDLILWVTWPDANFIFLKLLSAPNHQGAIQFLKLYQNMCRVLCRAGIMGTWWQQSK